jgi:farnesyl-diphosphate farnesyltransferase
MSSQIDLLRLLQETSRTFAIPIGRLPGELQQAVAPAYLCMRAIDEIEDHPGLDNASKAILLDEISRVLQSYVGVLKPAEIASVLKPILAPYGKNLPEVTRRLGEWLSHAPEEIALRIIEATAAMAGRMAFWARKNWDIQSEADLNGYTFSVAGAVGLLLCDIWAWFDGSQLDRTAAIQFGRGLQMVNIIRNRVEDAERGVNYFPTGWTNLEMMAYARRTLNTVKAGVASMPAQAYKCLVEIPLMLADATLDAIENGHKKLSRLQVMQIIAQAN